MATRPSIPSYPLFLDMAYPYFQHWKSRCGHTLYGYGIIAAATLLSLLLCSSPQVFAATTQSQGSQKVAHPFGWSCGDPNNGHCYGTQYWGGANGADTQISLNTSLNGGGGPNDNAGESFVTTELWLNSPNYTYWVEAGVISQLRLTGDVFPSYFWADNRPNGGGFSFHYLTREAYSGNVLVRITRSGSSNWNVLLRDNLGSLTGTSTYNNISIDTIDIGTELHNNYQTAYEPNTYYSNNRWLGGNGSFNYQGNDGVSRHLIYPVQADWYNGQDPIHSSTGGVWYSCILSHGC